MVPITRDFEELRRRNGQKAQEAWSVVLIFDYIAVPLARFSARFRVSPNIVTFCSGLSNLVALFTFLFGYPIWAVIALILATIFDCADGKIARLLNKSSDFGAKLDKASDFFGHAIVPLAIAISLFSDGFTYPAALLLFMSLVLARVHLKGIFGAKPLVPTPSINSWDSWCRKRGLNSDPVAETEMASLVPSITILEIAFSLPHILSSLVLVMYAINKIFRLYRAFLV